MRNRMMHLQNIIPEIGLTQESTVSSLQYGRMIQDAILCNRDGLKRHFGEYALLYEPKNILSGDFYFYARKKNLKYLAVCDCAGHGTSGALLTILGHNLLERAIKKFTKLDNIVNFVNQQFVNTFDHVEFMQGMDMIIVCIDENNKKISYSGARRPLWILRNNHIHIFKTDRSSVGDDSGFEFSCTQLEYLHSDRLFLFSDGYTDQFNELDHVKMGQKSLRESLIQWGNEPLVKIGEQLKSELLNFKGNNVFTDDVLLLGIDLK